MKYVFFFFTLLFLCLSSFAQTEDSLSTSTIVEDTLIVIQQQDDSTAVVVDSSRLRNPEKALMYSALVPGGGQIYNRQYWKAPLFAGVFGTSLAYAITYKRSYNRYNEAYLLRFADPPDSLFTQYTTRDLNFLRFEEKERYNVALALTLMSYGFNMLDAYAASLSMNSEKKHPPVRAAYYSAIVPGLGQIYNGKGHRIKAPFIWAGLGAGGYAIYYTAVRNQAYRHAYIYQTSPDAWSSLVDPNSNAALLLKNRERFLNLMEISIIVTSAWYILNVLDATVYAHLYGFDLEMEEDLSLQVMPFVKPLEGTKSWGVGLGARLQF